MKRVLISAVAVAIAASAWAGTLPNAGAEHVMRFGPLASGVFDVITNGPEFGGGVGVGVWGQYDRTIMSYAMRLGATVGDFGGASTSIDWESEYYIYLLKRSLRPFIMPVIGFGYIQGERFGDPRMPVGLYAGARWNEADSPFYIVASVGGKYVFFSDEEWGGWVTGRGQAYFGLTDTLALYAGMEFGRGFVNDYYGSEYGVWRGRFDVGPSWAF
jgi:hypothetical protein